MFVVVVVTATVANSISFCTTADIFIFQTFVYSIAAFVTLLNYFDTATVAIVAVCALKLSGCGTYICLIHTAHITTNATTFNTSVFAGAKCG